MCFEARDALTGGPLAVPGLHILGGQSGAGPHAVVARGLDIIHDPNPARTGLDVREDVVVLIPLDPSLAVVPA